MRILVLAISFLLTQWAYCSSPIIAYFLPGQGSDERMFSKITLDSNYKIVHITYPSPQKNCTLKEYAKIISKQIDTSQKYILIGVSLGGMICCELADYLHPQKIIIISSAKCSSELPLRYRFQKNIPLHTIVPKVIVKIGAQILQPIVEPDRKKEKATFISMLKRKTPNYYKRTVAMIINWERQESSDKIVHIHGTKDHTIPIRNVKVNYKITNGSHMMALTCGEEINRLILTILNTN